ncbi:NAD(P)H-hydrate dehydratase [Ferruginibacter sp. SUN106]|uniref:NAD(P)H-hydrate dehydratase n=1 Tax=Ferruginibacter sp. SUN106 TaxID=2978348 RepID=UPI003D35D988
MKIFAAAQIKKWDAFTIANEPVPAIDLMERAAAKCCAWIIAQNYTQQHFSVFCGKGNNGGDGLAIARMLIKKNYTVTVYILEFGNMGTADFQANLARLHECSTGIHFIQSPEFFPVINDNDIIIDALFGTGLNKPLEGISAALVSHINQCKAEIIAIDLPSGLSADNSSKNNVVIKATHTLSFQNYKLAFLLPENESFCGNVHLLNIGLHKKFEMEEAAAFELSNQQLIKSIYKPRNNFSHKGNFGHAALLCGSLGMMGAAVLSAQACLRSGIGKLTCFIPQCGYGILQTTVPEAMCRIAGEDHITVADKMETFDAAGIGPGMGLLASHALLLKEIFSKVNKPMLIDADALNTISLDKTLLDIIPQHSILTPHPKEFEKLFGTTENNFDRLQLALQKSKQYNIYIILKGHFSFISTPEGKGFFNSTGNAGMATAGSGDVLSGIITGLLAQGYTSFQACLMGTYLHGMAGDLAAAALSQEAMIAGDITAHLGAAFKTLL